MVRNVLKGGDFFLTGGEERYKISQENLVDHYVPKE